MAEYSPFRIAGFIHREVGLSTVEQRIPRVDAKTYGGNQAWFEEEIQRGDGCGVIAAANLFYVYRHRSGSAPTREEYMLIAEEMYKYLKPLHLWNPLSPINSFGLPFFKTTFERIQRFLKLYDIACEVEIFKGMRRSIPFFIRRSLRREDPVLLFAIGLPKKSPYNNHYVLITAIQGDTLVVSSWGQRLELSLHQLLKDAWLIQLGRLKEI